MSSMYKYPTVAKFNPEEIKLPDCMYKMNPIYVDPVLPQQTTEETSKSSATQSSSPPKDSAVDEHKLHSVIAHQERLISRLEKIESDLLALTGDKVLPKGNKKTAGKKDTQENQNQESLVKSILSRQESLLQRIDALTTEAKKELSNATVDPSMIKNLSNQKTLDVCVYFEVGSSIKELVRFLLWVKQKGKKVLLSTYFHSSTLGLSRNHDWKDISDSSLHSRTQYDLTVSVVVKKTESKEIRMTLNPSQEDVVGEKAIIDYMSKALNLSGFK